MVGRGGGWLVVVVVVVAACYVLHHVVILARFRVLRFVASFAPNVLDIQDVTMSGRLVQLFDRLMYVHAEAYLPICLLLGHLFQGLRFLSRLHPCNLSLIVDGSLCSSLDRVSKPACFREGVCGSRGCPTGCSSSNARRSLQQT